MQSLFLKTLGFWLFLIFPTRCEVQGQLDRAGKKTSVHSGGSIEASYPHSVRSETNMLDVSRYDHGNTVTASSWYSEW